MKYTLLDAEKEAILGEVDHFKGRFEFSGKPLEGLQIERSGERVIAVQKGRRTVLTTTRCSNTGVFQTATALGNFRLQIARGGVAESCASAKRGRDVLKSSMPGKILKIFCRPGQKVEEGTPLMIMEAMKMENEIRSDHAGLVKDVKVSEGQAVESGAPLVQFEEA